MGKMKELYTIAQETQIDPTRFWDVADFLRTLDERLYDPPPDPEAVARVTAVARDLEGR